MFKFSQHLLFTLPSLIHSLTIVPSDSYRPIKSDQDLFTIKCTHNSNYTHTLKWYLKTYGENSIETEISEEKIITFNQNYKQKTGQSEALLEIKNLDPLQHTGDYICKVEYENGEQENLTMQQSVYVFHPLKMVNGIDEQFGLINSDNQRIKCSISNDDTNTKGLVVKSVHISKSGDPILVDSAGTPSTQVKLEQSDPFVYEYKVPGNLTKKFAGDYRCVISYNRSVDYAPKPVVSDSYMTISYVVLGLPKITQKPQDIYTIADNTAINTMSCVAEIQGFVEQNPQIIWETTWGDNPCVTFKDGKATIDPKKPNCTLKDISGDVTCVAKTNYTNVPSDLLKIARAKASIVVYDLPAAEITAPSQATLGDQILIKCAAPASITPQPTLTLTLANGDLFTSNTSIEEYVTVDKNHAGEITCRADSTYDINSETITRTVSSNTSLEVKFKPEFSGGDQKTLYVPSQKNYTATVCSFESNPAGSLTVVSISTGDTLQEKTVTNSYVHESFQVNQSAGLEFKCTAENSLGKVTQQVIVALASLPDAVSNLTSNCPECTQNMTLNWVEPVNMYLPLANYNICWLPKKDWYKNIDYSASGTCRTAQDTTYTITPLKHNTEYTVEVKVETDEGVSDGVIIDFTTNKIEKPDFKTKQKPKISNDNAIFELETNLGGGSLQELSFSYKEKLVGNKQSSVPNSIGFQKSDIVKTEDLRQIKLNIAALKPNAEYVICITLTNEADASKKCYDIVTPDKKQNGNLGSGNFSTAQLLIITALVLLIMLVVIDLSCHYMNECGIFSAILKSRQSSRYDKENTMRQDDVERGNKSTGIGDESQPLNPKSRDF